VNLSPVLPGTQAPIRAELERVLASPVFGGSERLRRLLRYLVESALSSPSAAPKEYTIGLDVFDRGPDYDPRTDSTVRVSAAKLRACLREYYLSEGKDAPLRIELPKGAYVPVFIAKEAATTASQPPAILSNQRWNIALPIAAAVCAALVGLWIGRWSTPRRLPTFETLTFRRGTITAGRFVAGGRDILYSASWEGGPHEVFSVRQGVPESRSIGLRHAQLLSLSHAGDVAVLRNPIALNFTAYTGTIARTNLAGAPPRDLVPDSMEADWNPRTNELLVVRGAGGSTTLEFPRGHVLYRRAAGSIRFPRFSPSGDAIAFADRPSAVLGDTRGNAVPD
jgi:hypothetical protein